MYCTLKTDLWIPRDKSSGAWLLSPTVLSKWKRSTVHSASAMQLLVRTMTIELGYVCNRGQDDAATIEWSNLEKSRAIQILFHIKFNFSQKTLLLLYCLGIEWLLAICQGLDAMMKYRNRFKKCRKQFCKSPLFLSIYKWFRQLLTSVCTSPSSIRLPLRECLLSPKRTLREFFQIF